ncbi:hypothetical protein [Prosthecodimorpha staleyi]|uniref:Uncharacterized protein n=1 Tax=Prosthecodimorpha staleyi TaxID=2840188 RepID=A0A947GFK4_9HYPH|nr:hypothetical protein [Prosthecodimorpha staleyi]MBT9290675.1 hypothetical protein [Prosthecodimorpha staleyi]
MVNYGLYGDDDEAKMLMKINDKTKASALLKLLQLTVGRPKEPLFLTTSRMRWIRSGL